MPSDVSYRDLNDPRALRALTHPVRLELLEALDREGPLTATQAAELLGESPANCSFHLRTLAKYGFVEEAPGGKGRQRPWRARRVVSRIESDKLSGDARLAAQGLVDMLRERQQGWLRRWDAGKHSAPAQWRDAAEEMITVLHLTAGELTELTELISAATEKYVGRDEPPGALPIAFTMQAFPIALKDFPADPEPEAPAAPATAAGPTPDGTGPAPAAPRARAARQPNGSPDPTADGTGPAPAAARARGARRPDGSAGRT